MSITYSRTQTVLMDNQQFKSNSIINTNGIVQQSPSVPAPKTGTLSTYTDANTATLTMSAGHGIATADKFDLYWADGFRMNCVAGTVSGNTVPFTGGTGSAIPPASTAIRAMTPQTYNFVFVWADIQAIVCSSQKVPTPVRSVIHFITNTGAEAAWPSVQLDGVSDYIWDANMNNKPSLSITSIQSIKISHDDTTQPQTISVNGMFAN